MKSHLFLRYIFISLLLSLSIPCFAQSSQEDWRSKMPVRRLHKKPAVIVVDSTDLTTYYLEPKEEKPKKMSKKEQKRLQEEKEKQQRIEKYLQMKAENDPEFEAEQKAREARKAALQAQLDSLLAIEYTIDDLHYGPQPLVWVDEPITESKADLMKALDTNPDRVMPKNVTMEVTNNDMFFYFHLVDGKPEQLRFHAQYYADDPLNIEKIRFVVNGFDYFFTPSSKVKKGKDGPRMYWETVDDALTAADKDLIYAISHASWARVVFIGADGFSHVKKFSEEQIQDFYTVLALYLKMGGKL